MFTQMLSPLQFKENVRIYASPLRLQPEMLDSDLRLSLPAQSELRMLFTLE